MRSEPSKYGGGNRQQLEASRWELSPHVGVLCYPAVMDRTVLQGTGHPHRQPAFAVMALSENFCMKLKKILLYPSKMSKVNLPG